MFEGIKSTFLPLCKCVKLEKPRWNSSYSQVELGFQFGLFWLSKAKSPSFSSSLPPLFWYASTFTPKCILCLLYIYKLYNHRVKDAHLVTLFIPRCSMTWSERARSRPRVLAKKKLREWLEVVASTCFNDKASRVYIYIYIFRYLMIVQKTMDWVFWWYLTPWGFFVCSASRLQVMVFLYFPCNNM